MAAPQFVREARRDDISKLHSMIKDLAKYEKASSQCTLTEKDLLHSLFPVDSNPAVFAHVAVDYGKIVGMAIWHLNYSTWVGRHGIYLEDLYVEPDYRNQGHGMALMKQLASICKERNYERLQWWCLKWNKPSIDFYEKKLGATAQDDWQVYRVEGKSLDSLSSVEDFYKQNNNKNNNKRSREESTPKENKSQKKDIIEKSPKKNITSISSPSKKIQQSSQNFEELVKSTKKEDKKVLLSAKKSNNSSTNTPKSRANTPKSLVKRSADKDLSSISILSAERPKREAKPPDGFKAGWGLMPL